MLPVAATVPAPKITVVATSAQVLSAWQWWFQSITPQPNPNPGDGFVFDQKRWGLALALDHNDLGQICHIANLYLASQVTADPNEILALVEGRATDICVSEPGLDPQIKKIIESPENFRHALSEHLAFWTQLASIIKTGLFPRFIVVLPNAKPTDPGPDGLSLSYTQNNEPVIEIRSVKSSINDPSGKIATADFRGGLDPDPSTPPDAQLDEFYIVIKDGYGFTKLERMLVSALQGLNQSSTNALRIGLVRNQCRLNAMLVADTQYAAQDRFASYSRIPRPPTHKFATYIGSGEWQTLAENTRQLVNKSLKAVGVI